MSGAAVDGPGPDRPGLIPLGREDAAVCDGDVCAIPALPAGQG